jgi:hypothetical protein
MKRFLIISAVVCSTAAGTVAAVPARVAVGQQAPTPNPTVNNTITVTGQVVDLTCKPATNIACNTAGVALGHAMGILGKDRKTYTIIGAYAASNNLKLTTFVLQTVKATGKVAISGSSSRTIDVATMVLSK